MARHTFALGALVGVLTLGTAEAYATDIDITDGLTSTPSSQTFTVYWGEFADVSIYNKSQSWISIASSGPTGSTPKTDPSGPLGPDPSNHWTYTFQCRPRYEVDSGTWTFTINATQPAQSTTFPAVDVSCEVDGRSLSRWGLGVLAGLMLLGGAGIAARRHRESFSRTA